MLFSPKFIALLVAVMALGLFVGWFIEGTTSTAALLKMIEGKPRPDRTSGMPAYDFAIDATKSRRLSAPPPPIPFATATLQQANTVCGMPYADPDESAVVLQAQEGQAIASVSLSDAEATRAADVVIEPGGKPLYVVLSANQPMVWRFSGPVGRVRHLVLVGAANGAEGSVAAGAVGIATQRIAAVKVGDCFRPFDDPSSLAAAAAATAIAGHIGKQPDVIGAIGDIAAIELPSARAAKLQEGDAPRPAGLDPLVWDQSARRFAPAGVMQIAAADVNGPETATPYDILPGQAGVAQLVASGALVMTADGYRIVKPIAHLPIGLFGAQATNFMLANGLPMPGGSVGSSCVVDEAGRPIAGCGVAR